jgi:hypothetical protein
VRSAPRPDLRIGNHPGSAVTTVFHGQLCTYHEGTLFVGIVWYATASLAVIYRGLSMKNIKDGFASDDQWISMRLMLSSRSSDGDDEFGCGEDSEKNDLCYAIVRTSGDGDTIEFCSWWYSLGTNS